MSRLLLLLIFIPFSHTLAQQNVGDIPLDPALDDTSFHLHDSVRVWQYYNSAAYWLVHKDSITRFIRARYHPALDARPQAGAAKPADAANPDGWLTIRFLINTEGRTGRYRVFGMDSAYQPIHFDPRISGALLAAIRDWPDWQPAHYRDKRFDTYQYICFRLRRGRITTISP